MSGKGMLNRLWQEGAEVRNPVLWRVMRRADFRETAEYVRLPTATCSLSVIRKVNVARGLIETVVDAMRDRK